MNFNSPRVSIFEPSDFFVNQIVRFRDLPPFETRAGKNQRRAIAKSPANNRICAGLIRNHSDGEAVSSDRVDVNEKMNRRILLRETLT